MRALFPLLLCLPAVSAWAHPGHLHGGFGHGAFHVLSGLDHLLVAVGVGLWASLQHGPAAARRLLLSCLPAMALGYAGGLLIMAAPGLNSGSALHLAPVLLAVVACLLLFTRRSAHLGTALGRHAPLALICCVGLLQGFAHGSAMHADGWAGFGIGMALGSALVGAAAFAFGRFLAAPGLHQGMARCTGAAMLLLAVAPAFLSPAAG